MENSDDVNETNNTGSVPPPAGSVPPPDNVILSIGSTTATTGPTGTYQYATYLHFVPNSGTNGTRVSTTLTDPSATRIPSTRIQLSFNERLLPHGTQTAGTEDALTPLPITFTELVAFAGVGMGYSSAMLAYMQQTRTETHNPIQNHRYLSLSSAGLLCCTLVGLSLMIFIHHRENWRLTAVVISHLVWIMATVATVIVTILLFLS